MSEKLMIDHDLLTRLARVAEPHNHALLAAIREEFGDTDAATLHVVAQSMMLGATLKTIPHAERAPNGIAQVWAHMGVPFVLETQRVQ